MGHNRFPKKELHCRMCSGFRSQSTPGATSFRGDAGGNTGERRNEIADETVWSQASLMKTTNRVFMLTTYDRPAVVHKV